MKTYYIVETIPTGNGWTKRDTISENIGYGIGYCLGTLWYFLKWRFLPPFFLLFHMKHPC